MKKYLLMHCPRATSMQSFQQRNRQISQNKEPKGVRTTQEYLVRTGTATSVPFPLSFAIVTPRMDSCCAIFSSGYNKNEVFKSPFTSLIWWLFPFPLFYSLAARTVKLPMNQNTPFRKENFCSLLSLLIFHLLPSEDLPRRPQGGTSTQLP